MRDKINIVKVFKVTVLSFLWVCFVNLNSMAAPSSTLSAVEIKDSDNGYQVVLKADKFSEIRKTSESRDDIILDIKGMLPLESVGTVYNNVPDIDSVMIQSENKEDTRIIIHGKNIASANVYFAPLETLNVQTSPVSNANEIELSRPMSTYSPVFNQTPEYEDLQPEGMMETAASLAVGKAHQAKPYLSKLYRYLKKVDRKYLAFGAVFSLIILLGLKGMKPEKNNEIQIGLSQSLKERELSMRDELSLSNTAQTLRAQNMQPGKNAPSINYGIKAYQNSQRNPYTSQISGLPMKNVQNQVRRPMPQTQAKPLAQNFNQPQLKPSLNRPKQQPMQRKPMSAPAGLAANRPASLGVPQGKNIDSIKFLESMTKIYERSGRPDLANELKSSMQKAQVPS